ALPAVGGGIVRDLLLQRDPLGIVQNPEALLTVFSTVLAGMLVIKVVSRVQAGLLTKQLQARAHLGTRLIEVFDAIALAAFTSLAWWPCWTHKPSRSGYGVRSQLS